MDDLISRQAALEALGERPVVWSDNDDYTLGERNQYDMDRLAIGTVPSAQPTLYGYQIEHLALVARVMEQEGVTPEKAVETFGNISKIVQIIVEEQREIIRKVVKKWGT